MDGEMEQHNTYNLFFNVEDPRCLQLIAYNYLVEVVGN